MSPDSIVPSSPDLKSFLETASQYRLGELSTEQPHPNTNHLSDLAKTDLDEAIELFREIDMSALGVLCSKRAELEQLKQRIRETFALGGRVFLCGCGATGRLAISLETFWRTQQRDDPRRENVVSFMAGGDTALIRSIEGFEDFESYGARHLESLGFGRSDMLISCTEGGETPYVIGATLRAAEISSHRPWFLYCNPDHELRFIDRSRRVLDHSGIDKVCIPTGPMALSGSTRLQASTVLMAGVGIPLLIGSDADVGSELQRLFELVQRTDFHFLKSFIETESAIYARQQHVLYLADRYAVTVLTDTTERGPTFNLRPFENRDDPDPLPSLCYLMLPRAADSTEAWEQLLGRCPRPLDWPESDDVAGPDRLLGFDFSRTIASYRSQLLPDVPHHRFLVGRTNGAEVLTFQLGDLKHQFSTAGWSILEEHIILKLMLNIHSTLVMGRLDRYQGNVMTWVRPSNRKLIDRAIRYVDHILRTNQWAELSYEELAHHLFAEMTDRRNDESIVLKTVERVRRGRGVAEK